MISGRPYESNYALMLKSRENAARAIDAGKLAILKEQKDDDFVAELMALLMPFFIASQSRLMDETEFAAMKAFDFYWALKEGEASANTGFFLNKKRPLMPATESLEIKEVAYKAASVVGNPSAVEIQLAITREVAKLSADAIAKMQSFSSREAWLMSLEKQVVVAKKKLAQLVEQVHRKTSILAFVEAAKALGFKRFQWVHNYTGPYPRILHKADFPQGLNGGIFEFNDLPVISEDGQRGLPGVLPYCQCTLSLVAQ